MDPTAKESIAARLSTITDLYYPRSSDLSDPKSLLLSLLSRDPALFLERYGAVLIAAELVPFQTLAPSDYSVSFHLSRLRSKYDPSPAEKKSRSVAVKNRRRAYLVKLVEGGEYFSEEAMREREPYLHHEMVGRFQDPMGRVMCRPGERWSETLMRRCEEAEILEKIREEQRRRGVDRREWVGGGGGEEVEVEVEVEEVASVETESDEEEGDGPRAIEVGT